MEELKKILIDLENNVDIQSIINQRKIECEEENKIEEKGNPNKTNYFGNKKPIGINKMGTAQYGGIISASSEYIEEDRQVIIENGLFDNTSIKTGNLAEVYEELLKKLKNIDKDSLGIEQISKIIYKIVNEYFGEKGDVEKRLEELPEQEVGIGTLNLLKGKNLAACVERALLSQNLFKIIGIDATLKQSSITINEKEEAHAYNIIRVNGQNYIYDASLPSNKENGEKDVIVGTISDEEYMLIIDGLETGCKTNKMENGIIYDSSFGTLEEELKKYSKEEIQQLRNQAKLDEKANVISEIKQKMDKLKEIKQQVVEQELHQMQEEK